MLCYVLSALAYISYHIVSRRFDIAVSVFNHAVIALSWLNCPWQTDELVLFETREIADTAQHLCTKHNRYRPISAEYLLTSAKLNVAKQLPAVS